jgi:predicted negative regulator of RcsB-dependent stress response
MADQTLLVNRILLELRARLASISDPVEEAVIRLNLAAALARVEAWSDARTELQRVKLPDGPGVGNGTVQYLVGLCADKLGNRTEAETAWKAAAASESQLTEDGPSIKELAEAKLAELQRRAGRGPG